MFIIKSDLFEKLPDEAKSLIEAEGMSVSDEAVAEQIEKLAGKGDDLDANKKLDDENNLDDIQFGDEDEYSTKMDSDGRMEDMPESKKNSIKDFDTAHTMGNALIRTLSEKGLPSKKKAVDKVEKIPEAKDEEKFA